MPLDLWGGPYARDGPGHTTGTPSLEGVGIFYTVLVCCYTAAVATGLFLVYANRRCHAIRIRGVAGLFVAVLTIYVYAALIFIVYPLNGDYTCGAEFWVMNTIFPYGIALFQAHNVRLWFYYDAQDKLRDLDADDVSTLRSKGISWKRAITAWREMNIAQKTYTGIFIGGFLQLLLTIVLFVGSRRMHADYGFFGDVVDATECRRGFEWIPSVFWQFTWAWFFGPYVLYKIRNVHDSYYWGLQTKLAIVASLPGTPLWVAFLYSDSAIAAGVNRWWLPAAWFFPGLLTMQAVAIVFPLIGAYQEHKYIKRPRTLSYSSSVTNRSNSDTSALEVTLLTSCDRLLSFAAHKEFSAENVLFLRAVLEYKAKWERFFETEFTSPAAVTELREAFKEAAYIYYKLIDPRTAKFNINIESSILNKLRAIFATAVYTAATKSNVVTPWDDSESAQGIMVPSSPDRQPSVEAVPMQTFNLHDAHAVRKEGPTIRIAAVQVGRQDVPAGFGLGVFDEAYASIHYLVLTNTWAKYLEAEKV